MLLHFVRGLPRANDHFADAAHGLAIRRHDRQRTQVVQNVFGRDCFFADAAFSKGDIFRNTTVQVMRDHNHVEGFFERIYGERPRRGCRRWDDVCLTANLDDVWSVSATGSFRVKSVNRSSFESGDSVFDKSAFVERVSVDKNLNVHVVRNREAAIDR